jgi:Uma2 family endonuclease
MPAALEPTLLTRDSFALIRDEPNRHELIRGELVTMPPPSTNHGYYASNINIALGWHVQSNKLGVVLAAETGFLIESDPDTVRAPDVAFIRADRWPAGGVAGYFVGAPDFVVEVLSPSDNAFDVENKIDAWLDAGARLAWLVNPRRRTVIAHRPGLPPTLFCAGQSVPADDVVPGFSMNVNDIFE